MLLIRPELDNLVVYGKVSRPGRNSGRKRRFYGKRNA